MSVCFTYLYILSTVSVLGGVTSNQSRESADEIEQSLAKRYVKVFGKTEAQKTENHGLLVLLLEK